MFVEQNEWTDIADVFQKRVAVTKKPDPETTFNPDCCTAGFNFKIHISKVSQNCGVESSFVRQNVSHRTSSIRDIIS